jgi:hypothetical protein
MQPVPGLDAGVIQGTVLASVLAGFAFVGATSAFQNGHRTATRFVVLLYFSAGMMLLLSIWISFLFFTNQRIVDYVTLLGGFAAVLVLGSVLFVLAVSGHIFVLHGRATAGCCLILALATLVFGWLAIDLIS